ncbi:MG2 domain-containing protein [Zavarzinia sp.]|uniref:MG2 domain-containing protein n=1 Tax=Zavarzinia sp. TaxID=2027920 RepID=UPI003564A872
MSRVASALRNLLLVFFVVGAGIGTAQAGALDRFKEQSDYYVKDLTSRDEGKASVADAKKAVDAAEVEVTRQRLWQATDLYERAISLGLDDAATWSRLAELQLQNSNYWRAIPAAYRAYTLAAQPAIKVAALDILGTALERNDDPVGALLVYREAAKLKPAQFDEHIAALEEATRFRVINAYAREDADTPSLCLDFYGELQPTAHYEDYVEVAPKFDGAFFVRGKTLCIEGAHFGEAYQLSVAKGLPGAGGLKLDRPEEAAITVGNRPESLGFTENAYILPKVGAAGIPLLSVNTDKAKLALYRINDRNIMPAMATGNFMNVLTSYDADEIAQNSGELVWKGEVDIENVANKRVVTAIDIEQMRKTAAPGIYVLTAAPATGEQDSWDSLATQWVVVTDVGLTTFTGNDGLSVFARSLSTGKPVAGIDVGLYARNNEELAKLKSDGNGLVRFDPGLMRAEGGRSPGTVMAFAGGGDFTFLDLTGPAFDLSDRGVSGRMQPGPLDVFAYAERGVYRPGETAHVMALLRDDAGNAVDKLPLTLKIMRPDGVEVERRALQPNGAGGYDITWAISGTARTGTWTLTWHTDPEKPAIGSLSVLVEDVVPARIETKVVADAKAADPARPVTLTVDAKYLFGTPAADLRTSVQVVVGAATDPFPDHEGYRFGLVDETVEQQRINLDDETTDAKGHAAFQIALDSLPDTVQPLVAMIRADVFETSGRPVSQRLELPIHNKPLWLGIKPGFADDEVAEGGVPAFDLIALDQSGRARDAAGVRWLLVREDWDYQWSFKDGGWTYEIVVRDKAIGAGTVDLKAAGPVRLETPKVDYGRYRLELTDASEGAASSTRFHAGWYVPPSIGETPDKMTVVADKPQYAPGETAKIRVQAPFAGELLLTIATDKVVETRTVSLPAEGTSVDIPVAESWGAGAYVLATAFRPGDADAARGPGRAIGLAWLGIDPATRRLQVAFAAPDAILPRQKVTIPVEVSGIAGGAPTYVTVAAVDEGILQLTDFATPDPVARLFGKRQLGLDIRDAYGRLLNAKLGKPGVLREGGDGDALGRRGAPPSDIKLTSLFSGIVALDDKGKGTVSFDVPDYNGRLRLMAVAWNGRQVGSAEQGLVVRDPVVVLSSTARFLGVGDSSRMTVTLSNTAGKPGSYKVTLAGDDIVQYAGTAPQAPVDLPVGATKTVVLPIKAVAAGLGKLALTIEGPDGFRFERTVGVGTRAPQLPSIDRLVRQLKPKDGLTIGKKALEPYVAGTPEVLLSLSPRPSVDVAGLLRGLDRYPYGCLEQTTSRALPLLYVGEVAKLWQQPDEPDYTARINKAIAHLMEMQRDDGSFALWSYAGDTEAWLTAYAMDFLTRARARDIKVQDFAYKRGLTWLKRHAENRRDDGPDALASRSYALYVLAAAGVGELGATRYMHDAVGLDLPTPLAMAQVGAALALMGDNGRATEAFDRALAAQDKRDVARDYGSNVRDLAAIITLAAETKVPGIDPAGLAAKVTDMASGKRWLSTQEEAWLLMAARSLADTDNAMSVAVGGQAVAPRTTTYSVRPTIDQVSAGLRLENTGEGPVWYTGTVIGVPAKDQPAGGNGMEVERRFFTMDGKPINPKALPQGTQMVAVIAGRTTSGLDNQLMVIDLLPAGFEVENPRLVGSTTADELGWLPDMTLPLYSESLDDRYVAAFDTSGKQEFAVAYIVRAVTPGTYRIPAVNVEDMYRPDYRAHSAMGTVTVVPVE